MMEKQSILFLCGTDLRWYFGCLGRTRVVGLLKRGVVLILRLRCKCLPFCTCFLAFKAEPVPGAGLAAAGLAADLAAGLAAATFFAGAILFNF